MTATAVLDLVADAIVTELNDDPRQSFGQSYNADRSYGEWNTELKDTGNLHVDVVGAGYRSIELADQSGTIRYVVDVQVAVRKRLEIQTNTNRMDLAELDELRSLTERIAVHFVALELPSYQSATWVPTEGNKSIEVAGDAKHLQTLHQFSGVARLSYEVLK